MQYCHTLVLPIDAVMWNLITTARGDVCWTLDSSNNGINWQKCTRTNIDELWAFIPVPGKPSYLYNSGQPYYPYPPLQQDGASKVRDGYTIRPYSNGNLCLSVLPGYTDTKTAPITLLPCDENDRKQQIYIEWVDHGNGKK